MRVLIVVGLFLGFVAVAWAWAFHRGPEADGGGVPLLSADSQPTREKPTDPGGMKVVDIDPLSYDSGRAPPKIENILPAPEKPMAPPPPPAPAPKAAAPATMPSTTAATAVPTAPAATSNAPTARSVAAKTGAQARRPVAQSEQPAPKVAVAPMAWAIAPPSAKPQPPKMRPVALREEPKPEPRPAPVAAGNYRVQLASLRSAADAHGSAAKLRSRFGDVLGAVGFDVVTVDLPGRGTYYRVMTGPMSQGAAARICDTLRERGAACLLAR
jgi:hypothetical protein